MKKGLLVVLCAALLGAAYVYMSGTSSEAKVQALLEAEFGDEAVVVLDGCDLQVTQSATTELGTSTYTLRADLHLYDFETVQTMSRGDRVLYVANRETPTNAMLDQVDAVFAGAGPELRALLPDRDGLRAILSDPAGKVFTNLMAQMETDADDQINLIAHEYGPKVHAFTQQVLALDAPVSYLVTTMYRDETLSADGLLTGEVIALPPLQLSFAD